MSRERASSARDTTTVGALLQYWRGARRKSQLALAHDAGVSPRHVCFIETGRAKPSREMLLLLAGVLDVPLRERNALLLAGGFAPVYREAGLDAPELGPARRAFEAILRQQEPYPAVVMDRYWNLLMANRAAERFFAFLLGDTVRTTPPNVVRLMFDPEGLRPYVTNWEEAAEALVRRIDREAVGGVPDTLLRALLDEVFGYRDVPARLRVPNREAPLSPLIPIAFRKAGHRYAYFSTVTTLGTPADITLQELRIECFFPVDAETERNARAMALDSA